MIFVPRSQEPKVLRRWASLWLGKLQAAITELRRLENDPTADEQEKKRAKAAVERAQDKYRHKDVKEALVKMFHGKCAYCESKVNHMSYGDIEHFYPKSEYIHRTFEWTNLLFSCQVCNNPQHKGTTFPVDNNGVPLLIDPTTDLPEDHLDFKWDPGKMEATVDGRDARGRKTVETFKLNDTSGKELLRYRSRVVRGLMVVLSLFEQGNDEARAYLLEACQSDAPYAAFARALILPRLRSISSSG